MSMVSSSVLVFSLSLVLYVGTIHNIHRLTCPSEVGSPDDVVSRLKNNYGPSF